jgi:sigma-B regulation protein RsbU (phosphoserine phosphatase)
VNPVLPVQNPHVLVVDDSALDRKLLVNYLSRDGYAVETATDGLEAWELLQRESDRFDVVLLDRSMPRLSGLELLTRMKEHPHLRIVPAIMQTASATRQEMVEGIRAGAYYYLTKPYDVEMLLSVVGTAVADYAHYKHLQQEVRKGLKSLRLLREAVLLLQTVEQAHDVGAILASTCPDPYRVVVGLTELLVNAVEHGNLSITYDEKTSLNASGGWNSEVARRMSLPENQVKRVEVRFARTDEQISFTIRDEGKGFDWQRYLEVDPQRAFDTHGRGIAMANRLSFSSLEYRGCGNEVIGTVSLK